MKESRWSAAIGDISLGGIRLILRRRFEPGSGLGIELPARDGSDPYTVLARVVHIRAMPDGSWALGCKFISELSEDELQRLLPQRQLGSEPEPPATLSLAEQTVSLEEAIGERVGKQLLADVQVQLDLPSGPPIRCRIRRLAVPASWPFPTGRVVALRGSTRQGPLLDLRLQVVRCSQQGGRWTFHCVLLAPSAADLRRSFGLPS
jgi:hypothetical protein